MKDEKSILYKTLTVILFVIAIVILFFINGHETRISGGGTAENVSSTYCSANGLADAFFSSTSVNTIKNELKITFKNGDLSQLFYTYTGVYRSYEVAEHDEAVLHAKYNIYFGDNSASPEILSPSFSTVGTKLRITLYVEELEQLTNTTAQFFFIEKDKVEELKKYSEEAIKNYYEQTGFTCKIND